MLVVGACAACVEGSMPVAWGAVGEVSGQAVGNGWASQVKEAGGQYGKLLELSASRALLHAMRWQLTLYVCSSLGPQRYMLQEDSALNPKPYFPSLVQKAISETLEHYSLDKHALDAVPKFFIEIQDNRAPAPLSMHVIK